LAAARVGKQQGFAIQHLKSPKVAVPVIQLEDFRKTYISGEVQVHAVRGVTLAVQPGEFVAIMGASGSGKSTMMNTLAVLTVRRAGGSCSMA
jgi:ABC-type lipoprotein export system ATPase subunit